jgi:cytochrome c oxidase assembly protein subunit 15
MGTVVGMLSIALAIIAWRVEPRRWVRWLATGVLGAVIFQGVLGGLRVVLVELDLAIVHACFAQAFFCLAALMCVVTSKWWIERSTGVSPVPGAFGHGRDARVTNLARLAIVCVVAIYLQLIVGAMMRHYNAGLAIPDVPLNYGHVLPPTSAQALQAANDYRKWELHLPEVTMTQVWLHFGHRVGAVVVSGLLIALIVRALRVSSSISAIRNPAIAIAGLLIAQVTLGVMTVLMKKPADIASAHVACGALLLMTTFVLTVRAARLACDTGFQPVLKTGEQRVSKMADRAHGLEARITMSAS